MAPYENKSKNKKKININNKSEDLPVDKFKRKGSKAYRMYPPQAPGTTEKSGVSLFNRNCRRKPQGL